ncbi:hypothetical protein FAF44_10690 [Nonomuraea sp. MG754425]|uniref:hypothetical protein n=1 Tax=Nonomuraea sp. MG754425 TaxID=2570319 RepID=UPI001F46D8DB|nr:hypothetical protein [Nonomuraea sp. MG754425]MCF6468853.1 hypothetical protein [Nonomuraea sp. MG754425]
MDKTRIYQAIGGGVLSAAAFVAGIPAAHAIVTIVPCSGAALVAAINTAAPGATLNLTPGCTYVLNNSTGPLPPINTPLTIHGRNSTIQRASGSSPFRLFTVNSNFNLDRVRLMGGDASTSPGAFGGAVAVNSGTTNLDSLIITNNTGTFSGGLGGINGTIVNVTNSVIQRNSATLNGGGAANDGRMTFSNSVINNNQAGAKGGGIASDGILVVNQSTVNDNTAGNVGGGIANIGPGTATVTRSVVNNNRANNAPGGIDNEGGAGTVTLTASVVRGNTPTNCAPTPVAGCVN